MMVSKLTLGLLLGLFVSRVTGRDVTDAGYQERGEVDVETSSTVDAKLGGTETCSKALDAIAAIKNAGVFDESSFLVHRNGEGEPCGMAPSSIDAMENILRTLEGCEKGEVLDKYEVESFLTRLLAELLAEGSCGSTDDEEAIEGFLGYCDMGPKRTPILTDHELLVPVPSGSLPCRFFTREGVRISSLEQFKELTEKSKTSRKECAPEEETCAAAGGLNIYAVPAGRLFMFAPKFVGELFEMPHVSGREGQPISIEVLSLEPRVFDVFNFFSTEEADELIEKALSETSETHKLSRSTTGIVGSFYKKRTSDNAWDTHGKTAIRIKRRSFDLLGMDEYIEGHSDGLQILRYNKTTAYTPHMDYLDDPKVGSFDYASAGTGGNRFATILLYMTDLGEHDGGETVFTEAWPPEVEETDRVPIFDAIKQLRESGDATELKPGSWEETMAATCRSKLSVRPHAARAVLFYSQYPNGEEDLVSKHGGCPVLGGDKWAANLWVFSTPREGYPGAPVKEGYEGSLEDIAGSPPQVLAKFRNSRMDPRFDNAELYYDQDGFFGKLGAEDLHVDVNTYEGHVWNIKADGEILKTFVIGAEEKQEFVV